MKLKNEYLYCVAMESGHLCLWSMATNRADSWRSFKRQLGCYNGMSVSESRKHAQKDGHRCVRLRVTTA